jgi:hypothetical protein
MLRVSGLKRKHGAPGEGRRLSDPSIVGTEQPHRAEMSAGAGAGAGSMPEAHVTSWP